MLKASESLTLGLFCSLCKSKIPQRQLVISVHTIHVQQCTVSLHDTC